MELWEKTVESETLFEGKIVTLKLDKAQLVNGRIARREVVEHPGGVAVLPLFDDGTVSRVAQLKACFKLGLVKEGNTLEELAKNAGIDPKALVETIRVYNGYVDAGKDPDFNRPKPPFKIEGPKFYAIEITPAIHYAMGGLKFNAKTQVINTEGKPIEGLFAAGETTGGLHGKNRLGGNSVSETITFGRIAGEEAAKRVLGE